MYDKAAFMNLYLPPLDKCKILTQYFYTKSLLHCVCVVLVICVRYQPSVVILKCDVFLYNVTNYIIEVQKFLVLILNYFLYFGRTILQYERVCYVTHCNLMIVCRISIVLILMWFQVQGHLLLLLLWYNFLVLICRCETSCILKYLWLHSRSQVIKL